MRTLILRTLVWVLTLLSPVATSVQARDGGTSIAASPRVPCAIRTGPARSMRPAGNGGRTMAALRPVRREQRPTRRGAPPLPASAVHACNRAARRR